MSLTLEWRRRIERWRTVVKSLVYQPLGSVDFQGFTTLEQLSLAAASQRPAAPLPEGTKWGAKWEYGWFFGEVTLPEAAAGARIVVRPNVGAEGLLFVNGQEAGGIDRQHHEVTLALQGTPGTRYALALEGYAGHGFVPIGEGPVPHGVPTVPETPPTQKVMGESTFGIWREDLYQLWVDVETLFLLRDCLDAESLRVAEIDQGLRDFTVLLDLEVPYAAMQAGIAAARERLRLLLACVNGSTAPTLYTIGHSHIDIAWLWPQAETERKMARTLSSQLAMAEAYPEYRYLQSQPIIYDTLKRLYPALYQRVKAAVAAGTVIAEGGMWVEADTNVTGGESLIRQCIHGKRFFREEFGVECQMLWLPDVFGYSGTLPQILRGCGIDYFATAKIMWNYNGGDPFPYNTFTWEGIDGTTVLAHLMNGYGNETHPAALVGQWKNRVQKDGIAERIHAFGWGDGGGGATRDHLEYLRREADLEGVPRTRMASPITFFEELERNGIPNARYVGELYYQCHRGTYTSQARTKRGNRKSELALREAELWSAAAQRLKNFLFPAAAMDAAWKTVLLNQFHDIIPGSSIERVYQEAEAGYARVLATAQEVLQGATTTLAQPAEGAWTLFNSLNWPRAVLVPVDGTGAVNAAGDPLPAQEIGGKTFVEVTAPACGWTTLRAGDGAAQTAEMVRATATSLENALLRVEFNGKGEIVSLFDKVHGDEFAAGPCNQFRMYKDVPTWFDAWDVDSMYPLNPVELPEEATIEVVTEGPLVATLRVTRTLQQSTLTQEISLRRGSRRVEFHTTIDWREQHRLLKVAFPVRIHANEGVHEIQFGHIRRPNHYSRPFDADRFEVAQQKWSALAEEGRGVAVLNDCKYGVNILGNSINLTALRSPTAPDMHADQGVQQFTYAVLPWHGSLAESNVVREAYELNVAPVIVAGDAGEASLFAVDAPNVIIDTVKPAEDGSGEIIVRLYESSRTATRCTLATTLLVSRAQATNMLEEPQGELELRDGTVGLEFRAFEVKTIRLS